MTEVLLGLIFLLVLQARWAPLRKSGRRLWKRFRS